MIHYFKNIDSPFFFLIDADALFMITISMNKESASLQYSWNKEYVQRMLNAFFLDDMRTPIYQTMTEAEFYLNLSKVHGLSETNFTLFEKHHFNNQ